MLPSSWLAIPVDGTLYVNTVCSFVEVTYFGCLPARALCWLASEAVAPYAASADMYWHVDISVLTARGVLHSVVT